jgi:hypothetical protein
VRHQEHGSMPSHGAMPIQDICWDGNTTYVLPPPAISVYRTGLCPGICWRRVTTSKSLSVSGRFRRGSALRRMAKV